MNEIVALDALALSEAIRTRRVSCRETLVAYLDRIDALNPTYNAIVSLQPRETLLAQADERDAQLARGQWLGWMHGLPQALKDLSPVRGMRTTLGSPLYASNVPARDSVMVERMRAAGAIFVGRTNVPEFGLGSQSYNTVFGVTLPISSASAAVNGFIVEPGSKVSVNTRLRTMSPASWPRLFGS